MKSTRIYACRIITTALMLGSGTALADPDYSISYHETIDNIRIAESSTTSAGIPSKTLSLFVFGNEMVLELEPHDELTKATRTGRSEGSAENDASALTGNKDIEVLRGRVSGVDGSWVRLTRLGDSYSGVIYNAKQLLAIEPFSEVHEMITATDADETSHVIYDTDDMIPMKGQACAVEGGAGEPKYDELIEELRFAPALGANSRLNVAIVVDSQFVDANRANVDGEVISRLNVIDGIFSEQVGVEFRAVDIIRAGNEAGLTSSNASTLLGQFRDYGAARAPNPGLAHLLTGRNLNGGTVGIAFINTLCSNSSGYGVTQADSNTSVVRSALIAAHEFGHNFGATHDNQAGSVCAGTPGGFLMNPTITGADQFSGCSLNSMRPAVDSASCLVPVTAPPPNSPEPVTRILSAGFNTGTARGFNFQADPWGLGNRPQYQIGRVRLKGGVSGGALSIVLGGRDNEVRKNMSAGFERNFNLESTTNLTVSFKAVLRQSPNYESDEISELYASFNGEFLGSGPTDALASIRGDGDGGKTRSTGFRTYRFELNAVPAGQHTLTIGGFNSKKNDANEITEVRIDDVRILARDNPVAAATDAAGGNTSKHAVVSSFSR